MKKFGVILFILLLVATGCASNNNETKIEKKEGVINCTLDNTENGLTIKSNYEAKYKNGYVTNINSEEIITSENSAALEALEKQIVGMYSVYDDVVGYNYSTNLTGNTLTSKVDADYLVIDTEEMLTITPAMSEYIKDGKIKIEDIKDVYIALGAICN